jgi:hypothetical protein
MNDAYVWGFLQKCAEEGVDAEALLKVAQSQPAVVRQVGPQVAKRPPTGGPWQPTSPAEQAMMATRGAKSPGQRAAAYRQTYARAQGFNPEQQRIAGMQGATVNPYGAMQVKTPIVPQPPQPPQSSQRIARPVAKPVTAAPITPGPVTGRFAVKTPNLSPFGTDPGRFRMPTPSLSPYSPG